MFKTTERAANAITFFTQLFCFVAAHKLRKLFLSPLLCGEIIDDAAQVWSDAERTAFISWIAANPEAGVVIPGSGGCRKVRWSRAGSGKRGGVRVIYFNGSDGVIWLLIAHAKAKFDKLPTAFLAELKQGVEDDL